MRRVISVEGQGFPVQVDPEDTGFRVRFQLEGAELIATAFPAPGGWSIRLGRRTMDAGISSDRFGNAIVAVEGEVFRFDARDAELASVGAGRPRRRGGAAGRCEVRTPMPGKVVRILRAEGEAVEAGDSVVVFEAMKMQNAISAPESGMVANMKVSAGTSLEGGELLFAVEPARSP